ncbi:hypothetical protein [Actinomadura sp. 6K520]|uniref:hypothetical protein n=1 Tax=Actinomadura sp. 6K520 TaxID=2530364 RepID=UPI00104FB32B|nr:hypothetical protein [Actinomadura sp. 6K520]TDE26443.1 hypothetical protein E1289_25560 [Actinomadura sp. 6K520]
MTGDQWTPTTASVVQIPARHSKTRKRAVGLTEEERQILLTEIAEITAELDELQTRTQDIAARVHRAESSPAREAGAA